MLFDQYNRKINYLRISVTDKCNLRCQYCMPEQGIKLKQHKDILRLEEIYDIAKYAVSIGFNKIRITGGEPLVRKNIEFLIEKIGNLKKLKDFGLTTNGILLPQFADKLKQLGLHRVNISIDSLDKEKYRQITCGGELNQVLEGIKAAKKAKLFPIKLNVVLIPNFNEHEKELFINFANENDLEVRFIHKMNLECGHRNIVEGNTNVGQCEFCNRMRLTCDGNLKPCLFSDYKVNIRETGIANAFKLALSNKPEIGQTNKEDLMYQIGG